MVIISFFTKQRSEKQLHKITWWTRHDTEEPDLSDYEEEDVENEFKDTERDTDRTLELFDIEQEPRTYTYLERCKIAMLSWVCGNPEEETATISKEERAIIRQTMTSITQSNKATIL